MEELRAIQHETDRCRRAQLVLGAAEKSGAEAAGGVCAMTMMVLVYRDR